MHIPLELGLLAGSLTSQHGEQEVEAHSHFAVLPSVFMRLELHHLEVVEVRLLLRVHHLDLQAGGARREQVPAESRNLLVRLQNALFIIHDNLSQASRQTCPEYV